MHNMKIDTNIVFLLQLDVLSMCDNFRNILSIVMIKIR